MGVDFVSSEVVNCGTDPMSDPPPLVSPDGKFYWDGQRWVPIYPPPPSGATEDPRANRQGNTPKIAVIASILAVLLVSGLIWYVGFYDTASAKCNRGDLGACMVIAGQQASAQASQQAAVDSANAAAEASASASAQQQLIDAANALQAAMASGCTVVQDPNHNMRLTYIGPNSAANCASAKQQGWIDATRMAGSNIVCANNALVVEDTGGRVLGTSLCHQFNLAIWS